MLRGAVTSVINRYDPPPVVKGLYVRVCIFTVGFLLQIAGLPMGARLGGKAKAFVVRWCRRDLQGGMP
jgi:hypothetical protein